MFMVFKKKVLKIFSRVETIDGTAVAIEDYLEFKQSLVFEPGETMNYIEINIVDDNIWKEDEVFYARISIDPSEPGVVGRSAMTQIIVLNDDGEYKSNVFTYHDMDSSMIIFDAYQTHSCSRG